MSKQRAFEKSFQKAVEAFQKADYRRADKLLRDMAKSYGSQPYTTHLSGFVKLQLGELDIAERALLGSVRHFPNDPNIPNALGVIYTKRGNYQNAERAFLQALSLDGNNIEARRNLADLLLASGRAPESIDHYEILRRLQPGMPDPVIAKARALEAAGDKDQATEGLRAFLVDYPDSFEVLARLGELAHDGSRYEEARDLYLRALSVCDDPIVGSALGGIEVLTGDVEAGTSRQKRYFSHDAITAQASAPYIQNLNYLLALQPVDIRDAAESWARRHAVKAPSLIQKKGDSVLRVGLLTARVRPHPVRSFTMPWLSHRDAKRVEVHLFTSASHPLPDNDPYRMAFDGYHDLSQVNLDGALAKVREQSMDVMITPSGHEEGNLLRLFTAPLAPVQVAAFGIFGTTGIQQMTALVGDRFHTPEGSDDGYSEKIIRMPDSYICYRPADDQPELPSGGGGDRPPTFGSFNNIAKICDQTLSLWARVLASVEGSRLLLRAAPFTAGSVREHMSARMKAAGIDPASVALEGPLTHRALLEAYGDMDVALDALAYSGGVTTLEALWMGVPVVTLPGSTFARRHSLSHLMNAGMPEFIATSEDDYVARAAEAMKAARSSAAFRKDIKARVTNSPIPDAERYAGNFDRMLFELVG